MDGTFSALMSTNETYYDLDRTKCLTVKLEEMQEATNSKASADHNHSISAITGLLDLLLTAEDGNVKESMQTGDILANIKSKAVGIHTYYAMGGTSGCTNIPNTKESWRCLVHKTGALFGWVLAFGSNGSIYTNYLDNGTWKGWKAIYDANPTPLWAPSNGTGGYYMTAGHTVTPTKKLSECRNGKLMTTIGVAQLFRRSDLVVRNGKVILGFVIFLWECSRLRHIQMKSDV